MASTPTLIVLLILCLSTSPLLSATPSPKPSRTTSKPGPAASFIPSASFLSILRSSLEEIQQITSLVNNFAGGFDGDDLRLSSAISDCLDLLDLSSDELTWTISASQPSPASAVSGTGNRRSDLQSWLSAALGNQETCKEGLDNTDSMLGSIIADNLETVTSFISDGLGDMSSFGGGGAVGGGGGRRRLMEFPEWVPAGDRRLLQAPASVGANAVVAQDGSGDYTTISAAVAAAPSESSSRYVIYVKKGLYKENVEVKKKKWNIMLIGDGMGQTVISGSRSFVDGYTTYRSATFAVAGKGFIARDLTIENTAGPQKHQAVALRSDSDLSVFYRCSFSGYQDTLYAHSLRQFYRDCVVTGTVDFIFGNAAAVFQNCQIIARRPLPDQKNSVTAQGRKDPGQNTGFSFQFCNISAGADLQQASGSANSTASYLGRPWKEYSRTVFMQSYIGAFIRPEGWLEWNGDFALSTLYYAEYMNTGPGAGLASRVKWPGFHAISDPALVANFTVAQFIDGNLWLPSSGVKYTAGLSV